MEIIGFNEQMGGVSSFLPKMIQSNVKKIVPIIKKPLAQSSFIKEAVAKAKINPAAKAKVTTALVNAQQTGKSVIIKTPFSAKKFTPVASTPFNLVPTASSIFKPAALPASLPTTFQPALPSSLPASLPTTFQPALPSSLPISPANTEIRQFEQTLQTLPPAKAAQVLFNSPVTPELVQRVDPIQRSFLKTDLPYRPISKNNFGQPKTKVIKNTPLKFNIDIDQIQPAVDSGISGYYGK
jgi:hypothetical protein